MDELSTLQFLIITLIFVWSGFVRSGLGFGGAVLSLPFLLLIQSDPLFFLPILAIQLLVFSGMTVIYNLEKARSKKLAADPKGGTLRPTVDWSYLKYALIVMIIPKVMGVIGVITLPEDLMAAVIFCIVAVYSVSYILNKPFVSNSRVVDVIFLVIGGYMLGTSLLGAPFVITVFAQHVDRRQLRDTLFALWFVLVIIKLAAFIYAGVDLQLAQQLWLLPAATIGHFMGLRFHHYTLQADTKVFYRIIGSVLLMVSIVGIYQIIR
ncbi:MAG: TSUP family transporter [Arenicellaceae bacterium]|nr:TSUP family transporter [Arenicellaceae bacterium]